MSETILFATLGSEPQVITLLLDALLARGERIARVVVLHTDPTLPPVSEAVPALRQAAEVYAGEAFNFVTLDDGVAPLPDVVTAAQVDAAFQTVYSLLWAQKRLGMRLHLCIAGGRKTMALFAFAAAQLLFDEDDHVWHIESDEGLRASRRFHAQAGEAVTLIDVPFTRWSAMPGMLRSELLGSDARGAVDKQARLQQHEKRENARVFMQEVLTRAEREVVTALVRHGYDDKTLAAHLHKSPKTIRNQLNSAYQKFAGHYGMPPQAVDRTRLVMVLGPGLFED